MVSLVRRAGVRRVLLLAVVAVAVIVVVAGGFGRDGEPGVGAADMRVVDASRPEAREALRQAKEQRVRRASAPATRDRQRSRTRYRSLGAGQALGVGRGSHRAVLRDRVARPLAAARRQGMVVARYASDYAAVLRPRAGAGSDEPGVMAMSTLALRSRDDSGRMRPVDLSLQRQADGWEPQNPRVKVSIGDRVADGFRVSDRGVGLAPLDVSDQAGGQRSGDAVFFANSAADADHIVRVTPAGAESLVQLRSSSSPERFRYRIDLPVGGALSEQDDGSITISRDGRRVGTIPKPTAWDADQRPVEVRSTLQANVLTLDVAHRGRDIRYPAMVDPNYIDLLQYRWYANGANSTTNQYWHFATNQPGLMTSVFGNYQRGLFGQTHGLYSLSRANQVFPGGTFGYWRFTAPGTTSVLQAEWVHLSHVAVYKNGPAPCIDYGLIYSTTAWRTHGVECGNFTPGYRLSCWDCNDYDGYSYDPAVTGAQFGAGIYYTTIANISDYLGEATMYLADPEDPTIAITSRPPTGWTASTAATISATASDPGLGMQSLHITGVDGVYNSACLTAGPCTNSLSHSRDILGLSDGVTPIAINARDASYYSHRNAGGTVVAAQHQSTQTVTVKLDRGAPDITPSGTLWDARDKFVGPNQDYTLDVTATDGGLSSQAAQRSGVTALSATLDGNPMTDGATSAPCTRPEGSCGLSINAKLTAAQIQQLDDTVAHTVAIKATDALGHTRTDSFTFRVDTTEPSTSIEDSLAQLSGRTLTEDGYRLRVEASDNLPFAGEVDDEGEEEPKFDAPGAGLLDLVIRVEGQSVATSTTTCFDNSECASARVWDWDTRGAVNGVRTVTITATDRVGNADVREFQITLAREADEPARIDGGVRRTIVGAAINDRAGSAVAALGDVNGDGHADYAMGAPGVSAEGREGAGAAYLVLGSADPSTLELANPGTSAVRLLGPGANQHCGTSVAAVGDVNGDELADIAVGCPGVDAQGPLSLPTTGRVYVIFGRPDPQNVDLAGIGTAGYVITGPTDPLHVGLPTSSRPAVFGERLQSAPIGDANQDLNDDGLADIVIGDSAVARDGAAGTGAVYVVYGKVDNQTVDTNALGDRGYVIRGDRAAGLAGYSATVVDDLTGDTLADILVGAPGATAATGGRAYIVAGAAMNEQGALTNADVDLGAGQSRVATLTSGEASDRFGVNVAALGDTDLDPIPDIAIGTNSGAYVVRKAPTASRQLTVDDGYRVTGPANDPGLLSTRVPEAPISPTEDLDGDDRADMAIGYPDAAGARAYTIRSPEIARTISVTALPGQRGAAITLGAQSERSGAAVAANGYQGTTPVNENAQVIVGAPQASPSLARLNAGRAYVVSEPTPSGPGVEPPAAPAQTGAARTDQSSATGQQSGGASATVYDDRPFDELFARPFGRFVADPVSDATDSITVRNDFQLMVIGNLFPGEPIDVTFKAVRKNNLSGTPAGPKPSFYYHGRTYGEVLRCGWVVAYQTTRLPQNQQPAGPATPCGRDRRLSPHQYARLINCDHCGDATSVVLRGHSSADVGELARRTNVADIRFGRISYWRNVQPGTNEGNSLPSGYIDVRDRQVRVFWRYLTKSQGRKLARFALVRSPADDLLFGSAGTAVSAGGELPGIQASTDPLQRPETQKAEAPNHKNWPPVCAREVEQME